MAETDSTAQIDLAGLTPDEAFAILGNELRLDILRVLWNAGAAHEYDDVSDIAETISFSDLRRRVDVDDNGKFNYHLSQLVPHFVRHTDSGYRLSGAGKQVARTVIAVSGSDRVSVAADVDRDCPACSAPLTATYDDQWLRIRCTRCEGLFGHEAPDGAIFFTNYPAAGLADRSPDDAFATGFYRCMLDIAYLVRDVCRECAGSVTASLSVCDTHRTPTGEPCASCGTRFPVWADVRCGTCGFAKRLPIDAFVLGLTPVIGFLDELDIDILAPAFEEVVEVLQERIETTVAEEPFRVTVTIQGEAATLGVALDDEMNVVDVHRQHSA